MASYLLRSPVTGEVVGPSDLTLLRRLLREESEKDWEIYQRIEAKDVPSTKRTDSRDRKQS